VFFYLNVNYFGAKGGFDALLKRLEQGNMQLASVRGVLRPVSSVCLIAAGLHGFVDRSIAMTLTIRTDNARRGLQCEALLDRQFLERYLPALTDAVFQQLLVLSADELKREDKQYFHETATIVQNLLKRIMSQESIGRKIDLFNLSAGLRGFDSPELKKRLKGLRLIKKQVQRAMVTREERQRFDSILRHLPGRAAARPAEDESKKIKPLDPQYVVDVRDGVEHTL